MPLIYGNWLTLPQEVLSETLPTGITWPDGSNYLHFNKPGSRTKIDSLVATYGWSGMIGVFISASGGPSGPPDYILHRSEFPQVGSAPTPSISLQGNNGNRTYSYVVQALNGDGKEVSLASATATTTSGNVNLGSSNFNRVSWTAVSDAAIYNVYRTANTGNNPSTGKTGLIASTSSLTLDDTGLTGDGTSPTSPTLMALWQNVLDYRVKVLYADAISGARSFWPNFHAWVYQSNPLLWTPRYFGSGDYSFQVSDNPPGNPPWWQFEGYSAKKA